MTEIIKALFFLGNNLYNFGNDLHKLNIVLHINDIKKNNACARCFKNKINMIRLQIKVKMNVVDFYYRFFIKIVNKNILIVTLYCFLYIKVDYIDKNK